jgi:hypothetical protein
MWWRPILQFSWFSFPLVARQHPANAKDPAEARLFGSVVVGILVVVLQEQKYIIFAQIARGS